MQKKYLIMASCLVLVLTIATVALAASPIKLIVNGREIKADVPPQLVNGRTMVPVRWVAETLGAQVEWEASTQTVRIITAAPHNLSNLWQRQGRRQRCRSYTRPWPENWPGWRCRYT